MIGIEPPESQYDLRFRLGSIPVRVHWMFWLIAIFLGYPLYRGENATVAFILWVGSVFISILIHELGHAVMFIRYGGRPWIVLYGMGGLAIDRGGRRGPYQQMAISVAGPVAGFLFAGVILLLLAIGGHFPYLAIPGVLEAPQQTIKMLDAFVFQIYVTGGFANVNLALLVYLLLFINVFWGLINLMPIYPLDGGQIAREWLTLTNPREGVQQSLQLSIVTGIGLAILALVKLESLFMTVMFGYLAFMSYQMLQQTRGGGWRQW